MTDTTLNCYVLHRLNCDHYRHYLAPSHDQRHYRYHLTININTTIIAISIITLNQVTTTTTIASTSRFSKKALLFMIPRVKITPAAAGPKDVSKY